MDRGTRWNGRDEGRFDWRAGLGGDGGSRARAGSGDGPRRAHQIRLGGGPVGAVGMANVEYGLYVSERPGGMIVPRVHGDGG